MNMHTRSGQSMVEVILASGLFVIVATAVVSIVLQSYGSNRSSNDKVAALQYASEGIEAMRSIRNVAYTSLTNTTSTGLAKINGVWGMSGTFDSFGAFTRVVSVTSTLRDVSGNIVVSGGTLDADTKQVTVTVSWPVSPSRNDSVTLTSYLTNWRAPISAGRSGILVYGDGGTTSDLVVYRRFDGTAWGATSTVVDVETTSTNRYARAIRVIGAPLSKEKILIARHYNGTRQAIYAQVFNGTSSTWGNLAKLSEWAATTYLDAQNFDGTYLANGTFMLVYSDNSIIPKMRTWNGTAWSAQASLTTLGTNNIPVFITLKTRDNTNEAMAAFSTQASSTITQYYSGSAWSVITTHATSTPNRTKKFVDFDWSSNTTTTGAIAYSNTTSTKSLTTKIWVANGAGSGAWGAATSSPVQANTLGAVEIDERPGANEFMLCDKDALATPTVVCRKVTFAGNVATFATPINPIIAATTDTGIQKSFEMKFENLGGGSLMVYSDNTAIPKLKQYNPTTATWDASATTISTSPYVLGVVKTARVKRDVSPNLDLMAFLTDANLDLYSVMWDGTNNVMYTTPAGKAFTRHGVNGSATTDLWYDFAFDP